MERADLHDRVAPSTTPGTQRDQMATFLARLLSLLVEEGEATLPA